MICYTGIAGVLGCMLVPLFFVVITIEKNPSMYTHPTSLALGIMVFIWILNMLLVIVPLSPLQRAGLAAAALICVFSLLHGWTFIPSRLMRAFKFGNISNATLVLDETGCAIVRQHGGDIKTDTLTTPKTCALPNVTIRSRLGSTYYVEVTRPKGQEVTRPEGQVEVIRPEGQTVLFTIPGQDVLSWGCERDQGTDDCK